jgi:hypothetical protein
VPGNTPGVVLAYRLGSGASAQVMASFGAWNRDGSLRWSEAVALSGDQGEDQAFSLGTGATAGTVKVVFQKRESSPSPQDLLAEFRQAPGELLSQQLDALASGARIDSDLYVSTLRINAAGNGDYTLQLSGNGNTQTTTLTAATTPQVTAPPATASGGNTSLSRAALATNAAPESTAGGIRPYEHECELCAGQLRFHKQPGIWLHPLCQKSGIFGELGAGAMAVHAGDGSWQ